MDNRNVNPEVIRLALSQQFPRWGQAFECYRRSKPYGGRPRTLMVTVALTPGALICKYPACRRTTAVNPGERVSECCSFCGRWETSWLQQPAVERVPVVGIRGGTSDPYTTRDFCLDLERWCAAVTLERFGSVDGWFILELMGLHDCGRKKIAQILTSAGHPISHQQIKRISDHWRSKWEHSANALQAKE